jgi:SAM-dependent methyltransferase
VAPDLDRRCWCGAAARTPVGSHYRICEACGTAVLAVPRQDGHFSVCDDDADFYGRRYWFEYQKMRGYPDIESRSRSDLSERCVFWLKGVLEFVSPPGRTLEIGCGHGGFVRLLRDLGFDASGTELSPWVVEYARATFDVPVFQGGLESLDLAPGYRSILSFDVLEHVDDPLGFVRRCAELVTAEGVLVLQTPWYRGEGPDWSMFQPDEHVWLFTESAMRLLLERAGFPHVVIRPSLYPHDMWVVAGRAPLRPRPVGEIDASGWRVPAAFQALVDLRDLLENADRDRAARLAQVHALTGRVHESESEAGTLLAQIEELTERVRRAEAEAENHRGQIEELTRCVRRAETEAETRLGQIEELTTRVRHAEQEADARLAQINELTERIRLSQADGDARLAQIHELTGWIKALQAEGNEANLERLPVGPHEGTSVGPNQEPAAGTSN